MYKQVISQILPKYIIQGTLIISSSVERIGKVLQSSCNSISKGHYMIDKMISNLLYILIHRRSFCIIQAMVSYDRKILQRGSALQRYHIILFYIYVCVCVCVYMYAYVYVYVCARVCVYSNSESLPVYSLPFAVLPPPPTEQNT